MSIYKKRSIRDINISIDRELRIVILIDKFFQIQQFGLQISQSQVDFSAFGISLNYQVLGTVRRFAFKTNIAHENIGDLYSHFRCPQCLKTVTTYLVIMIQVSNSLESSKSIQGTRSN